MPRKTLAVLGLMLAIGCGAPDATVEPTFPSIQENVFNISCASSGCHGEAQEGALDLREGAAYEDLVNVPAELAPEMQRVQPGDAEASFLYVKLRTPGEGQGVRMPVGSKLPEDRIDAIREWIEGGAER